MEKVGITPIYKKGIGQCMLTIDQLHLLALHANYGVVDTDLHDKSFV